jgi:hypothetical protein
MGLRERIERELRAALRAAEAHGGGHVNVAGRVNKVVVRNVGGGAAAASAEQTAPIVQEPSDRDDE